MSKDDICFVYLGEIYYKIEATDKQIDEGLHYMVEQAMYYDDFEYDLEIPIQAQISLIYRQAELIIEKHCK